MIAADQIIAMSGDRHHTFIENFDLQGNKLELLTGS